MRCRGVCPARSSLPGFSIRRRQARVPVLIVRRSGGNNACSRSDGVAVQRASARGVSIYAGDGAGEYWPIATGILARRQTRGRRCRSAGSGSLLGVGSVEATRPAAGSCCQRYAASRVRSARLLNTCERLGGYCSLDEVCTLTISEVIYACLRDKNAVHTNRRPPVARPAPKLKLLSSNGKSSWCVFIMEVSRFETDTGFPYTM